MTDEKNDGQSLEAQIPEVGGPGAEDENQSLVPVAPKGLKPEDDESLKAESSELVEQLKENINDRKLARSITSLGMEAQQMSSQNVALLQTRMGDMLGKLEGHEGDIPNHLLKMRTALDEINPHVVGQPGKIAKLFGRIPGMGKRLAMIAHKYETAKDQINLITASLKKGQDNLLEDNIELEKLYGKVEVQQLEVKKNKYLGQLVWQKIDEVLPNVEDALEKRKLQTVLHRVATRVQDMAMAEQVNLQFFLSIDSTIENNEKLGEVVTRQITITTNLVMVGLSIQAALARQRKTIDAVKAVKEYSESLIKANAKALREGTADINQLLNEPVLAIAAVEEAFDDIMAAMDESEAVKEKGILDARAGMVKLSEMSEKLEVRGKALHDSLKQEEE
jgi:uncharacterized protein YaaN involved in tellurite resistance